MNHLVIVGGSDAGIGLLLEHIAQAIELRNPWDLLVDSHFAWTIEFAGLLLTWY